MSYRIAFQEGTNTPESFPLATTGGWGLFVRWVEGLPPGSYPALRELTEKGYTEDTSRLAVELTDAWGKFRPNDDNLNHTIEDMIEVLGSGSEDEVARVDDGMEG